MDDEERSDTTASSQDRKGKHRAIIQEEPISERTPLLSLLAGNNSTSLRDSRGPPCTVPAGGSVECGSTGRWVVAYPYAGRFARAT
jgi:hypothetical protein